MSYSILTPGQEWYREYLQGDHWQRTRRSALERAGNRCQVCNSPGPLEVHHRTYDNVGAERPEDLFVLCRACHSLFESNGRLHRPPERGRNFVAAYTAPPASGTVVAASVAARAVPPPAPDTPVLVDANPSGGLVFIAFVALLVGFYAIGIILAFAMPSPDDAANLVLGLTVSAKVGIGWFAVRDRGRNGELSTVRKLLIFACAFLPFVIWLASYWAAREVARQRRLFHLTWIGAAVAALLVYLIFFAPDFLVSASTGNSPTENPPAVYVPSATARISPTRVPSTATRRPSPTATARPTQRPTSRPDTGCQSYASVTLRDVGRDLCVYGDVWQEYENEQAYFVEFSRADNALYLVSYDFIFPDLDNGDCVMAEGEIDQLGDNPVMVVRDLYHCE